MPPRELKPCKPDQYRNPKTNRCVKVKTQKNKKIDSHNSIINNQIPKKSNMSNPVPLELYTVYLRTRSAKRDGMTIYLGAFLSKEDATKWVIKNGPQIQKEYDNTYTEPFAIFIMKFAPYVKGNFDDISELNKLQNGLTVYNKFEPENTFCFSDSGYKMLLEEHLEGVNDNWAEPIASHIVYCKNGKLIYGGCDVEHFKKATKNYFPEHMERYRQKFNIYRSDHGCA